MPVGELFLSACLQVLFDRLASRELLQFLREEGVYTKVQKWGDTLEMIQALLGDAEEKQLTKPAVKKWLDNLQDLAYDVEDILDEFATEASARKLKRKKQPAGKIWKLVPDFRFRIRMRSKVKDVTTRFDELCELRNKLGLQVITGESSSTAAPQRPSTTTSQPTEPAVYGRDADAEEILEKVLKTDANLLVIPIVGMGGVGKTTLARLVYNHQSVEAFEVKAWVCVSDGKFDVTRISKSILENITGSSSSPNDLSTVQNELVKKVNGKKFLIVLDDVWNIDYVDWENLQSPFKAVINRIIVTTRDREVALTLTRNQFHPLSLLSDEDCWLVFSTCAFDVIPTHYHMDEIREKVIDKCKRLPLAAKTLGGLLRSKQIDSWLKILNSTLWDLCEDNKNGIPAALKLSYHHLPSHLKRCFAFCSVFPKDYEFQKEEIVFLWMAQGLLQQSKRNIQPEDLGCEYFNDLLSRSMFQQSSNNDNRSIIVMHDLVHDLAEWASREINIRLNGASADNKQPENLKNVRHFSYTVDHYDGKNKFAFFNEAGDSKSRVRTFLPIISQEWSGGSYITNLVPFHLLPKLKRLRILSLRSYNIFQLPDSIGGLKHLRYLNLSKTKITNLPESTCLLYNLRILLLRYCFRLVKLPSNFRYLIKLRHLDIEGAILIKEMPSGMKDLESLQMLSNFIVGKGVVSNLEDLKSLKMLCGQLCISGLHNVADDELSNLILEDKKDLKELVLEWRSQFDDSRDEVVEKNVLDMIRPHQHLEKLTITCYGGTRFSSWVGDPSFIYMIELCLRGCEKCTSLPSLGRLLKLKHLTIIGMKMLRDIGCEIYGDEKPFRSLESLRFEDLPEWENWEPNKEDKFANAFLCLQELSIVDCPKLSKRLPDRFSSLEKLVIKNCKLLVISFSRLPRLCNLEIEGCKGCAYNNPTDFKSLKSMTLSDISEFGNWIRQEKFVNAERLKLEIMSSEQLMNLWQLNETFVHNSPQGLQSFISITQLTIENCSNLVSFPEVCLLSNLSRLDIRNCSALTSLPNGMNHKNACLGSLRIQDCDSLTFIVRDQFPSSLKSIQIESCEKLQYLWDGEEGRCTSLLQHLEVEHCPSLKCLSSSGLLPETLQTLTLAFLPELESIAESFHSNMALEKIFIQVCKNLKSIPVGLHYLSHLRTINIWDCESIDCLGEAGLPNTSLRELTIIDCRNLKALPNSFHNLNSLESLKLVGCPSMTSFPEDGFPTNLASLCITGDVKIYKQLLQWGLHNLTSLKSLKIRGSPEEEESFPEQEMEMKLPPSLTRLRISSFPNLKCLMGQSFRNLNSLEGLTIYGCPNFTYFPEMVTLPSSIKSLEITYCPNLKSFSKLGLPPSLSRLDIWSCPEVRSFPEQGLPSSLWELHIGDCPKLKEGCKREKGKEWSKISHIPRVRIDYKSIYEL